MDLVRWSLEHEWVTRLSDLVERRLMLVFHESIRLNTLHSLADEMESAGLLNRRNRDQEIESAIQRLWQYYGRRVLPDAEGCTTVE